MTPYLPPKIEKNGNDRCEDYLLFVDRFSVPDDETGKLWRREQCEWGSTRVEARRAGVAGLTLVRAESSLLPLFLTTKATPILL